MQIKRPIYKDSLGSWRTIANHLSAIIDEAQKYAGVLKNMSLLLNERAIGPTSFYKLNWDLSPSFDYEYAILSSTDQPKEKDALMDKEEL